MSAASGCISKFNYGSIFIVIKTKEIEHVATHIEGGNLDSDVT
jgi:hypothetical protein